MTPSPGMPHRWPVRVYYEDTDFSGVVYHASYLRFLERGRTEWLRDLGVQQSDLQGAGAAKGLSAAFAVRGMTIDFKGPARMDDLLTVVSRVAVLGGASVTMHQQVERDDRVLVDAVVRLALVAAGRAVRLPATLAAQIRQGAAPPRSY